MTRNGPNQANYDESIANPDPDLPDPLILNVSRAEYDLAILGGGRRGRRNGCYLGSPLFSQPLKGRKLCQPVPIWTRFDPYPLALPMAVKSA